MIVNTINAAKNHDRLRGVYLFAQLVMLAQLGGYRVGHDLAAVDFSGLAPINRGVPTVSGLP